MKKLSHYTYLVALPSAIITAFVLSYFVVNPAIAEYQLDKEVKQNCRELKKSSPDAELDIRSIEPDTGLVAINQPVEGRDNIKLFSFKSSDNFEGCNDLAKKELAKINSFIAKQDADTCADFRAVVEGRKPVHEKDGRKGDINAAKRYVEKHCQ